MLIRKIALKMESIFILTKTNYEHPIVTDLFAKCS